MRQRSLKNQHRMLEVLLERFDAVDVTGLSAWERARAVHGRTAAGLSEGGEASAGRASTRPRPQAPPSESSLPTPLFTEEAA